MDHFVAEGAEGGLPRQGFQQGPRQQDFAEVAPIRASTSSNRSITCWRRVREREDIRRL
jgi:hypothetical protein